MSDVRFAGVELGGTKCVCVRGTGDGEIHAAVRVPTRDPETTMAEIEAVLDGWRAEKGGFAGLGIASFGPLDLDRTSPGYGRVVATSKPGWSGADVAGRLERRYGVPTGFQTDVAGAAVAEGRWGAARDLDDFAYVTVGTGIGVGLVVGGRPLIGLTHPEAGHIRVKRLAGDPWPGSCPYHGDCVEGLASGSAIAARTGRPGAEIGPDDPVWAPVAHALGELAHTLVLTVAPRRIIIGGSVMLGQPHLYPRVRAALKASLAGFGRSDELLADLDGYVVPPMLGNDAGPKGALALAADARAAMEK